MVEPSVVEEKIVAGVGEVSHIEVKDLTGTKDHYEALVVSSAFQGKSRIDQHKMVYAALGDLMDGPVHALALKTLTPENWKK